MQGSDGRGLNNSPYGGTAPSKLNVVVNDGTLNAIVNESVRSFDGALQHPTFHEDEMLSWLHYPVDDSLDKGYCSDLFGDLPNPSVQIVKHSFNQLGLRSQDVPFTTAGSTFCGLLSQNPGVQAMNSSTAFSENIREAVESCGSGPAEARCRVAGADAAVVAGRDRAADFTSHFGAEVLSRLDSEVKVLSKKRAAVWPSLPLASPSHGGSSLNVTLRPSDMESGMSLNPSQGSSQPYISFTGQATAQFPALKSLDTATFFTPSVPVGRHGATNFSLFSGPVVDTKASLHMVGGSSGPTNVERVRQQCGQLGTFQEPAAIRIPHMQLGASQSDRMQARRLPPPPPPPLRLPLPPRSYSSSVELKKSVGTQVRGPPLPPCPPTSVPETREGMSLCKGNVTNSRMSNSAIVSSEKVLETLEITADQTVTSPSRCSASSTEKCGKEIHMTNKRGKLSIGDDFEYQSEDIEEMVNNEKAPFNAKRVRTAEMHNQSEKRRRVKINDKLKTLQELIPNANKPDRASLLDAVIEYVKLLQSQLQAMSIRTGIGLPSWMIPNMSMQHLQMPALPQINSGMVDLGMGMRMGMGLMDVNSAAVGTGCMIMPMPQFPGQPSFGHSPHAAGLQPCDHLQIPGIMNPYNLYLAPSQVQPASMNLNMNQNVVTYNAYMQQQQLQVQLQQLHQLHGDIGRKSSK